MNRDEDDIASKLSSLADAQLDEQDAASRVSALEEDLREAGATEEEMSV